MRMIHDAAAADPTLRECTYNLFRNNQRPSLFCAVPEDRSVPDFIDAEAWSFERVLQSQDVAPPGFLEPHAGCHVGVAAPAKNRSIDPECLRHC